MIARVPGHDRAAHVPKRHHGDEEGVMFLPSVDANLTVCQSGLTRGEGIRWMRAHRPAAFDNRSFMLVSTFGIGRLLILDLRWRAFVALCVGICACAFAFIEAEGMPPFAGALPAIHPRTARALAQAPSGINRRSP
ncbi:hypothetical protein [Paraburkholderia bannensis]|uniref:hypothetical protein n=1 Tax=Paraburkholderia bannensis TaxID=765414 RepID=UPI002ABDB94C|nr:hypothetical protein [Paraburkholderia bannensis]